MELKRMREHTCFVEPPHDKWVYDFIKRHPELKQLTATQLEPERHAASSLQHLQEWFERMERELDPAK